MDTIEMYPFKLVRAPYLLVDCCGRWPCLFFFLSESKIVSHSPFACNWQSRFLDSEPIITHFSSNKGGNSDIQIPHDSTELHPTPCMCVVCRVCGLGSSLTSKQNVSSLIPMIPLAEFTNQKRGIVETAFCTPYDSSPRSLMMLKF